jgi:hypothetical protein
LIGDDSTRNLEPQVLAILAGGWVLARAMSGDRPAVKNVRLGEMLEPLDRDGRLARMAAGRQRLD